VRRYRKVTRRFCTGGDTAVDVEAWGGLRSVGQAVMLAVDACEQSVELGEKAPTL